MGAGDLQLAVASSHFSILCYTLAMRLAIIDTSALLLTGAVIFTTQKLWGITGLLILAAPVFAFHLWYWHRHGYWFGD